MFKMCNIKLTKHSYMFKHLKKYSTSSCFVTTPIFYVNAAPHLGHLYSALIADASHRFYLLQHPQGNTIFSTGTDEHGLKVEQAAGVRDFQSIKNYCDQISVKYQHLFDMYGIQYTHYIRTTDENHKLSVQHFWNLLKSKDLVYLDKYTGWYCIPDEMFVSENQIKLITNESGHEVRISELSGHLVEWTEEENFMFKLSSFKSDILYWLKDDCITPSKFNKILQHWLTDENLSCDISISRPSARIRWGVPVPEHPEHTVYVWLDALVNYLTVAGYPNLSVWPPTVQVIGKDILKFHGIYWPAFLIAAGLEPPRKLLVHSHWTVNDEKMSKSKNNVVDPFDKMKSYTASGFRYFLLKQGVPHDDGNYTDVKVINMLNADLANSLGNLLCRCTSKSVNTHQVYPALCKSEYDELYKENETLKKLNDNLVSLQDVVSEAYERLYFYKGIDAVLKILNLNNKFFEECKPWELRKDANKKDKLTCILHITFETLRISAIVLQPIIPEISEKIFMKLAIPKEKTYWSFLKPSWNDNCYTSKNITLNSKPVILYGKLLK